MCVCVCVSCCCCPQATRRTREALSLFSRQVVSKSILHDRGVDTTAVSHLYSRGLLTSHAHSPKTLCVRYTWKALRERKRGTSCTACQSQSHFCSKSRENQTPKGQQQCPNSPRIAFGGKLWSGRIFALKIGHFLLSRRNIQRRKKGSPNVVCRRYLPTEYVVDVLVLLETGLSRFVTSSAHLSEKVCFPVLAPGGGMIRYYRRQPAVVGNRRHVSTSTK